MAKSLLYTQKVMFTENVVDQTYKLNKREWIPIISVHTISREMVCTDWF